MHYRSGYTPNMDAPDHYQTTYDSKTKIVVFYSLICLPCLACVVLLTFVSNVNINLHQFVHRLPYGNELRCPAWLVGRSLTSKCMCVDFYNEHISNKCDQRHELVIVILVITSFIMRTILQKPMKNRNPDIAFITKDQQPNSPSRQMYTSSLPTLLEPEITQLPLKNVNCFPTSLPCLCFQLQGCYHQQMSVNNKSLKGKFIFQINFRVTCCP